MAEDLHLREIRTQFILTERNLDTHLRASFPNPGDRKRLRKIFREDIGKDYLGLGAHWRGKEIHFAYPLIVMAARKEG